MIDLTPAERVLLANQLLILEKLYPEEAQSYATWREAVEYGYKRFYAHGAQWVSDDELEPDESQEVLDIMTMYSQLKQSYQQLTDKSGINECDIEFQGFDGNNATKYLTFAEFFMNRLGRYSDLKRADQTDVQDLNSHSDNLWMYRQMLRVYKSFPAARYLTKDQIQQILEAQAHPDSPLGKARRAAAK